MARTFVCRDFAAGAPGGREAYFGHACMARSPTRASSSPVAPLAASTAMPCVTAWTNRARSAGLAVAGRSPLLEPGKTLAQLRFR
ncbi:hypothetical protein [Verrucomicrobium spinosum]|uniref:hypothetical protein n=1 Tax=Verrucomicrobium spinosum TaxID=2736 RepID=UPI001C47576F|nr:hypothetical protein [Verrucomicrobium spinosum]